MDMVWRDLLFMHWPVPVEALRPLIPGQLEIDTFDGESWIGEVPFRMTGVTLHRLPSLPWISAFPELNVRTYVTDGEKAGVWFFSLDAGNPLAVEVARRFFHLPYFRARMSALERDGVIFYQSLRTHGGTPSAEFEARYQPTGETYTSNPGSLEFWLTERYCLFAEDRRKRVWRTEIQHKPWPLQRAEADVETNTMTNSLGIELPESKPLLHFARVLEVVAWRPELIPRAGKE